MTIIWKSRWVIRRENKIFLAKWIHSNIFYLPWGTHERGESMIECLQREIVEELWIIPKIGKLLIIQEFRSSSSQTVIDFWFEILNADDFLEIDKSKCSHWHEWTEAGFYDISELKKGEFLPSDLLERLETKADVWVKLL